MKSTISILLFFLLFSTASFGQKGFEVVQEHQAEIVCDTVIICYDCCFEFEVVPKFFPVCFDSCNGNLDNVFEILHKPCKSQLDRSPVFSTAFTNITVNSGGTLGNCHTCSSPVSTGTGPVPTFNMAVCSPGWQSANFDITLYDSDGNKIGVCVNKRVQFYVPACPDDPFRGISVHPNPTFDHISWEQSENISKVEILNSGGHVVVSDSHPSGNLQTGDLENGTYYVRFTYTDGTFSFTKIVK
ncbi:T9SS type A sorting domain-containing protein [bacterium SCSIO 12741]|nr:T9SS type A sorting domain-containing protein [bacterium SCSIO 12741]